VGRLALVVGGHWQPHLLALRAPVADDSRHEGDAVDQGALLDYGEVTVLVRHGSQADVDGGEGYVLPHLIDHSRNMGKLVEAGCDRVLAIGSVGGLRPSLSPGTFICPDDFIALDAPPATALEAAEAHRVPGFDLEWRRRVLAAFASAGEPEELRVRDGGIYWQVRGPRLETPAEIRLVAQYADVIGMTIASECVAAGELGLRYAAVCVVDNFANGVADTELTLAEFEAGRARNRATLARALAPVLEAIG
jgi:purine nucleoside phosphorylase